MSGAPGKPSLLAFGPEFFRNKGKVANPENDVTDEQLNLLKWQVAGMGFTASLAYAVVNSDGTRAAAGAIWNPKNDPALHPSCARTATGIYTITWAATYANQKGTQVSVVLAGGGKVFPQSSTANIVGVALIAGTVCTVKLTVGNTGSAVDAKFRVEVC